MAPAASCAIALDVRNRGNGSRTRQPQSLNVMFPNDDPWHGVTQFNLNSQYTPWQVFGAVLFAQAGVPAPQSRAVQLRWNAANPASSGSPTYGFYACNEAWNSDLADHRFPNDSSGNLYRGVRLFEGTTAGGTSIPNAADFSKIVPGASETLSLAGLYKLNYKKQTNTAEDSWTDLIGLTTALAKGHSGTPGDRGGDLRCGLRFLGAGHGGCRGMDALVCRQHHGGQQRDQPLQRRWR